MINDRNMANPCGGGIERGWAAKPACADDG